MGDTGSHLGSYTGHSRNLPVDPQKLEHGWRLISVLIVGGQSFYSCLASTIRLLGLAAFLLCIGMLKGLEALTCFSPVFVEIIVDIS